MYNYDYVILKVYTCSFSDILYVTIILCIIMNHSLIIH